MRRILLGLSLVGLAIWTSAGDALAQGHNSSRGNSASAGRSNAGRSYSGRGYYGRSYYGGGYYGGGYYLGGWGLGYSPFYRSYGYGYAPSYYDGTPGYSNYAEPAPVVPTTQVQQSFYPTQGQDFVSLKVLVPIADAKVWFQNQATTEQGMQRLFHSPALTPNQNFTYTIKARWMENGQAVNQERRVNVQAGQNITVSFRENRQDYEAVPMPRLPVAIPQE
jgi:uncharacterized protein (TIGR03000 family)